MLNRYISVAAGFLPNVELSCIACLDCYGVPFTWVKKNDLCVREISGGAWAPTNFGNNELQLYAILQQAQQLF
jgi:hypothetical protein